MLVPPTYAGAPAGSSPTRASPRAHEIEFAAFIVDRDEVAEGAGCEAALRAERQLLERRVAGGLVDAAQQVVAGFQLGDFGGDQAEDHRRPWRDEAERLEAAGPFRVVLEQEPVDGHLVEQPFGDRVVAALRHPGAAVVAAAEMHGPGGGLVV